jgi:hypothetical protein
MELDIKTLPYQQSTDPLLAKEIGKSPVLLEDIYGFHGGKAYYY